MKKTICRILWFLSLCIVVISYFYIFRKKDTVELTPFITTKGYDTEGYLTVDIDYSELGILEYRSYKELSSQEETELMIIMKNSFTYSADKEKDLSYGDVIHVYIEEKPEEIRKIEKMTGLRVTYTKEVEVTAGKSMHKLREKDPFTVIQPSFYISEDGSSLIAVCHIIELGENKAYLNYDKRKDVFELFRSDGTLLDSYNGEKEILCRLKHTVGDDSYTKTQWMEILGFVPTVSEKVFPVEETKDPEGGL